MIFNKENELSFEFFPPRNNKEYTNLEETYKILLEFNPTFVSYTDGAGASKNRDIIKSVEILRKYSDTEVVAHITSCDKEKVDVDTLLDEYQKNNITSFLVIRGDCPTNEFLIDPDEIDFSGENEFRHASDLIKYLKDKGVNNIGFGAFPSGHPEDKSFEETLRTFKAKSDLGGNFSATQLFFEAEDYIRFHKIMNDEVNKVPIYAGIMPLLSLDQGKRFAEICDVELPKKLEEGFQKCGTKEKERSFGIWYITEMCNELIDYGVDGLHFYTLNRSKAFVDIYSNLEFQN